MKGEEAGRGAGEEGIGLKAKGRGEIKKKMHKNLRITNRAHVIIFIHIKPRISLSLSLSLTSTFYLSFTRLYSAFSRWFSIFLTNHFIFAFIEETRWALTLCPSLSLDKTTIFLEDTILSFIFIFTITLICLSYT